MNEYRYILEKGSKKHICPACGKKTFVRYIDTKTGEYLNETFGRCDRESNCQYHKMPEKEKLTGVEVVITQPQPTRKPVFIPLDVLNQTLQPDRYDKNTFIQNLLTRVAFPFEAKDIEKVISLYYLGTISNGYRASAITFPFIDIKNNIRAVQVKQFNEANHTTGTDFLHSIIAKHYSKKGKALPEWLQAYNENEKKVSCLFGEHLLNKYPTKPVILVEAPKTAVYGTLYFGFTDYIWLAVYNKSSFSFDKLKVLQGKEVIVFPDLSKDGKTFEEWKAKAKDYEKQLTGTRFIFSDLLEQLAPEADRKKGSDIADFLIKQDWKLFRKSEPVKKCEKTKATPKTQTPKIQPVKSKPVNFVKKVNVPKTLFFLKDKEITILENAFAGKNIPDKPIKLNDWTTITNVQLFIESHLATVKLNNGNRTFLPYLNRLEKLKNILDM